MLLDFVADVLQLKPHALEDGHRHPLAKLDQAQEDVLGAEVVVAEPLRLSLGQGDDLAGARREVAHREFEIVLAGHGACVFLGISGRLRVRRSADQLADSGGAEAVSLGWVGLLAECHLEMAGLDVAVERLDGVVRQIPEQSQSHSQPESGDAVESFLGCQGMGEPQYSIRTAHMVIDGLATLAQEVLPGVLLSA